MFCGIFLIFCRLCFINNFLFSSEEYIFGTVKFTRWNVNENYFSSSFGLRRDKAACEIKSKLEIVPIYLMDTLKLPISRPICFKKKIPHTVLKILYVKISWLFSRLPNHSFGRQFLHAFFCVIFRILFFECDYLILRQY